MERKYLVWGAFFGLLAVVIGAFGAHVLKPLLSLEQQQSFETGVRYQMYHALFLLFLSKSAYNNNRWILNLLVVGVFTFSFSIYLLNLREVLGMPLLKLLGPVTPLGGLLLISSWIIVLFKTISSTSKK